MTCLIEGCNAPILARGWCRRHYNRWARHGDPLTCLKPLSDRGAPRKWLEEHIDYAGEGCLIWPFARFPDGRAHMAGGKPSRFMCRLAHGAPPSRKHEAAHSCGKAFDGCVHPHHLRWATKAENEADKLIHGTLLKGEQLPQSKLTEADVAKILALKGKMFQREIAARFDVNVSCINKILKGRRWAHIKRPPP